MDVLKKGVDGKEILEIICKTYTAMYCKAEASMTSFAASPLLKPVADAGALVNRMCHCFGHLLGFDLEGERTTHRSVVYFSQYSGKDMFHSLLRDLLGDKPWQAMVQDVIRCSGSSELLQPQRKELMDMLYASDHLDKEQLARTIVLYKSIKGGMRSVEICEPGALLREELERHATLVVKSTKPQDISVGLVDVLLSGLEEFGSTPGMLSLAKDLQSWATQHSNVLRAHELAECMKNPRMIIADAPKLQQMIRQCGKIDAKTILESSIDGFLCELCQLLLDKDGVD